MGCGRSLIIDGSTGCVRLVAGFQFFLVERAFMAIRFVILTLLAMGTLGLSGCEAMHAQRMRAANQQVTDENGVGIPNRRAYKEELLYIE